MRVAFFGSGPFAVPVLEALLAADNEFPLVNITSRPDRPGRRGRKLTPMPVKERALQLGVECDSPESANAPEYLEKLRTLEADLFVVADYGEILREPFLETPRSGAFNLHASILPKYRGAAPVARAILGGEARSGVTLFRIERTLDSGPIVAISEVDIGSRETAGELEDRLAKVAADLIVGQLPRFASGEFEETPQNHDESTHAPKLSKQDGEIDWRSRPEEIVRFVRGMSPWPSAYSFLERVGKRRERTTFLAVEPSDLDEDAEPGSVVNVTKVSFSVACRGGSIRVLELKREAKAAVHTAAYLRGRALSEEGRFSTDRKEKKD